MKRILLLIILAVLIVPGKAHAGKEIVKGIEVYTFKKERVDQQLAGNRGYLQGKPGNIPSKKKSDERTMIGIDVELPSGLFKKNTSDDEGESAKYEEREEKSETAGKVVTESYKDVAKDVPDKKAPSQDTKETAEETEEEWIK
ncbi:MAG: hypothetical protein ABH862_02575 [Candidatus Omnitrophota bacterium]